VARVITVGAAQLGPIARREGRALVVKRLRDLLREAHGRGCDLVVFPELALTTFFPRWWMEDQAEIDAFFERDMPGPETRPLFDEAARLGVAFCLGYAELTRDAGAERRYNTSILVDRAGRLVGKYRKVHLPGHAEHEPWRPLPASREALLRRGRPRVPGLARPGRRARHVHLQRPPLAGDLPGDGAPGRRDDPARLQHAGA
jgi:predicted amidohydrolase